MLRRSLLSLTPLALFRASAAPPACPSYFAKGLQARWSTSLDYTLAVLDKMPDENFGFRPTPEEWTFSQQLTHIADGSLLIAAPLHGDKPVYVGAPPRQFTRTELKKHLEHSYDYVHAGVPAPPERCRRRASRRLPGGE